MMSPAPKSPDEPCFFGSGPRNGSIARGQLTTDEERREALPVFEAAWRLGMERSES
jgi:hypothetical protein